MQTFEDKTEDDVIISNLTILECKFSVSLVLNLFNMNF